MLLGVGVAEEDMIVLVDCHKSYLPVRKYIIFVGTFRLHILLETSALWGHG